MPDWLGSFIGPAVVAAFVSGVVSVAGFIVSGRTAKTLHKEKLEFDREQARARSEAEIGLAERKFTLDRDLAAWERRVELSEQALIDFYAVRDVIAWARAPFSHGGEGDTRERAPWESDEDARQINNYWVPVERMNKERSLFDAMQARRYRFVALFGHAAATPFDEIRRVRNEVVFAASMLAQMQRHTHSGHHDQRRAKYEATIGWGAPDTDALAARVDAAVEAIENTCRAVIEARQA